MKTILKVESETGKIGVCYNDGEDFVKVEETVEGVGKAAATLGCSEQLVDMLVTLVIEIREAVEADLSDLLRRIEALEARG